MSFNSFEYLFFFLGAATFATLLVRYSHIRLVFLLFASYVFYTQHNKWLVILILISTQIDYVCSLNIHKSKDKIHKKIWLYISVVSNLGILGVFKYFNFFTHSLVGMASLIGVELSWVDLNIVLPVGISFYTFQSMSYTIDVYRGVISPEKSWTKFSLYVAFFPQLVAGPIVRAKDFLPQLLSTPTVTKVDVDDGLYRLFKGLFKKIIIADFLMIVVDNFFGIPGPTNEWLSWMKPQFISYELANADMLVAWIGVYAFAFQIYFDFSGYTDIAIGCAKLLGYKLPENFNNPYRATSFTDFWHRWHISLSTWLRDYVYISFGGNRHGDYKTYRNIMITMLLGGLWHGASWTFVIWGGAHGVMLCIEKILNKSFILWRNAARPFLYMRRIIFFHLICLTWVLFRSLSLSDALTVYQRLFSFEFYYSITVGIKITGIIIAAALIIQWTEAKQYIYKIYTKMTTMFKSLAMSFVIILMIIAMGAGYKPFIYFQF